MTCPPSQLITSTSSAPVTFSPPISAVDFNGQSLEVNTLTSQSVTDLDISGGIFGLGTTDVLVTVTDANGLPESCQFTVTGIQQFVLVKDKIKSCALHKHEQVKHC